MFINEAPLVLVQELFHEYAASAGISETYDGFSLFSCSKLEDIPGVESLPSYQKLIAWRDTGKGAVKANGIFNMHINAVITEDFEVEACNIDEAKEKAIEEFNRRLKTFSSGDCNVQVTGEEIYVKSV